MDQRNKDFKPGPKIYLVEVKVDGACQARWKTTRQVFTQAKPWSGHLMEFDLLFFYGMVTEKVCGTWSDVIYLNGQGLTTEVPIALHKEINMEKYITNLPLHHLQKIIKLY